MRIIYLRQLVLCLVLATLPAHAQLVTQNPLDQLKEQLADVLAEAGFPFTTAQEGQVALLVEEQRQASESLFGDIMDFSDGIPEGAERDRALASIQWLHDAFRAKLPDYLTIDQRAAVEEFESQGGTLAATIDGAEEAGTEVNQIQQIRVTNNTFNVENGRSGSNGPQGDQRTEVIERGGSGAFHGNFVAEFEDDALNARNPTADNKPESRERTISGNISGPVIQDRLTASFSIDRPVRSSMGWSPHDERLAKKAPHTNHSRLLSRSIRVTHEGIDGSSHSQTRPQILLRATLRTGFCSAASGRLVSSGRTGLGH